MKTILIILLLATTGIVSKAQSGSLTLFNISACPVRVAIVADDNANSGGAHCSLASNISTVMPFVPITFANTAAVAAGPGWMGTWTAGATSHHWDGIRWNLQGTGGCSIGNTINSCLINVIQCQQINAACGTVTATYNTGVNDIITFN